MEAKDFKEIYQFVRAIIENEGVSRNDIVLLGDDNSWLCRFDAYYRYRSGEKTHTTMETLEERYFICIDRFLKDKDKDKWLSELLRIISKKKYGRELWAKGKEEVELKNLVTKLLLLAENCKILNPLMNTDMSVFRKLCENEKIDYERFRSWYAKQYYQGIKEFQEFVDNDGDYVVKKNIDLIRQNRKEHFQPNPGVIKMSTIHSFKGCESNTVILCTTKQTANDELLYVGITRAKKNLYILNYDNDLFEQRLRGCKDNKGNLIVSFE